VHQSFFSNTKLVVNVNTEAKVPSKNTTAQFAIYQLHNAVITSLHQTVNEFSVKKIQKKVQTATE